MRVAVVASLLLALLSSGCESSRPTSTASEAAVPNIRSYVAGEAAERLDANGSFALDLPRPPADIPIVSPGRARELAKAYLRTWGPSAAEVWSAQSGRRIECGALEVSPRVYYADTPHGRIPDGYHPAYQRMVGPWYLLQLTLRGEPVVALAVSAYSTDLQVRDGVIHEPVEGGEYFAFRTLGMRRGGEARFPVSPEESVQYVSTTTGARVVRVPELVLRNSAWSQFNAQWKLVLDHPVTVESLAPSGSSGGRARARVRELFVGPGNTILISRSDPESSARMAVRRRGAENSQREMISVTRRPEMSVRYDEVRLVPEG